jgi:hypothetical protein
MRRMLTALAVGLLTFASSAWADATIIQWSRIEGVIGADLTEINVGPFAASIRWRTTSTGTARINLSTGYLSFRLKGASAAKNYLYGTALGAPSPAAGMVMIGTVVCNATEKAGRPVEWADTPVLTSPGGSLSFEGYMNLPASCTDYPEDVVFLIRHTEDAPHYGAFNFYGADRTIRQD